VNLSTFASIRVAAIALVRYLLQYHIYFISTPKAAGTAPAIHRGL